MWAPMDDDRRILGPLKETYPQAEGWMIDGEVIRLDRLSIKKRTAILALRKMKAPTCEKNWVIPERLELKMPWTKIWSIKFFYAAPRDQITWLKIMHRNLFLAGNLVEMKITHAERARKNRT